MSLLVSTVSMVTVFNVSIYLLSKPVIEDHMGKSLGLFITLFGIISSVCKGLFTILGLE